MTSPDGLATNRHDNALGEGDVRDLSAAFRQIVERRKSTRAFRPDPVPDVIIRQIFELAQWSPSNCNTQPWITYVLSGAKQSELRDAFLEDVDAARGQTPEVDYLRKLYPQDFTERQTAHIMCQQDALRINRDDKSSRMSLLREQLSFFGAPHVALLFMPEWGNEREASDIGMYAQTLLLGLTAYGLAGIPQALLGLYASPVRRVLNVESSLKLLFGVSFGYADVAHPAATLQQAREPVERLVRFL